MRIGHAQTWRQLNTLRPRPNGHHFADDIFKGIFLDENIWIPVKISLKFVPKGAINNIPALVQMMAWRRSGDRPLSETMVVGLPTHICVIRSQWVKSIASFKDFDSDFAVLFFHSLALQQVMIGKTTPDRSQLAYRFSSPRVVERFLWTVVAHWT